MKKIIGKPFETNQKLIELIERLKINNFYLKNNMKLVGKTSWAKGTLPGDVYVHNEN